MFWAKQILSDTFAFTGYVSLLIHAVGSICLVMMPCLTICTSSASNFSLVFYCHVSSAMLYGGTNGSTVRWCWTGILPIQLKDLGKAVFRELRWVIWCLVLFLRPPLPPNICWSLPVRMVSIDGSLDLKFILSSWNIYSECHLLLWFRWSWQISSEHWFCCFQDPHSLLICHTSSFASQMSCKTANVLKLVHFKDLP